MAPPVPPLAADFRRAKCAPTSAKFVSWLQLHLLLFALFNTAASKSIIKTLPGYSGTLPFKLETGYVSVGESDEVQLFYYFTESEKNPEKDPLVLWLSGGPGCSSFDGFVYEIGPFMFDLPAFNGSSPSIIVNPYSWTQIANIIFLDTPAGSGFSYSTTSEGYYSSDSKSVPDIYNFLRKWLLEHPKFIKNPLYIGGDSYSGIIVPMLTLEISNGNEANQMPHMFLQGYLLGNPLTDNYIDGNSKIPYAHRMALISDEYYESAKRSCNGDYVSPDPNNSVCNRFLRLIKECTAKVNDAQILEPKCFPDRPKPHELKLHKRYFEDTLMDILPGWCRTYNHLVSWVWENDPNVQAALHVRYGTKPFWRMCNRTLAYDSDVPSVVEYHQLLSRKGYRALIYSGDHDMLVPYMGTLEWIRLLNLTTVENWRPWFVYDQVAGYTQKYKQNGFSLTYATVKGAGHTAPETKPEECFAMADRWFSNSQL